MIAVFFPVTEAQILRVVVYFLFLPSSPNQYFSPNKSSSENFFIYMLWVWLSFHDSSIRLLFLTWHLDYYGSLLTLFPKSLHVIIKVHKNLYCTCGLYKKYLSFFLEQMMIIYNLSSFCADLFTQRYTSHALHSYQIPCCGLKVN